MRIRNLEMSLADFLAGDIHTIEDIAHFCRVSEDRLLRSAQAGGEYFIGGIEALESHGTRAKISRGNLLDFIGKHAPWLRGTGASSWAGGGTRHLVRGK